jgi:hypothetical protein
MISSLATPEFETTPIGSLMTYARQEGVERGRYIEGQAPPSVPARSTAPTVMRNYEEEKIGKL